MLYSFTPEIFPTKDRGTGNALTATANRVFGIMAVSLGLGLCRWSFALTVSVAYHRNVRKPANFCAGLYIGRTIHRGGVDGDRSPIRDAGQGELVGRWTKAAGAFERT